MSSLITGGKTDKPRAKNDYYPTPSASTISLFESPYLSKDYKNILEPACGEGHIAKIVKEKYPYATVDYSDLYEYPNSIDNGCSTGLDFLSDKDYPISKYKGFYDLVITNPPYESKVLMPFVKKSLELSNKHVAMFLKITFLESIKRYKFFKDNQHLKQILVFSNRQPIYAGGIVLRASNAICYAWYIWDKDHKGLPQIDWLDNSELVKSLDVY